MKTKLLLFLNVLCCCIGLQTQAQTLVPGDVVVLGIAADTGLSPLNGIDEFSWMPLVNLPAGTKIYFTDAGWYSAANSFQGSGDTSEFLVKFVAPNVVLAGTVMTVTQASTPSGYTFVSGTQCGNAGAVNFPNAGDSVIAFQSNATEDSAFPGTNFTALFALTNSTTNWAALTASNYASVASFNGDNVTNLPPGLTASVNSLAVGNGPGESDESDNVRYQGSTVTGSRAVILAAVTTYSNWGRYDAAGNNPDLTSGAANGWTANGVSNYTVSGSDNIPPVVQSITLSGSPASNAASVTFTVTFDETVSNVSTDDFTVATVSGNATGTVSSVSGSGNSYTLTVGSISGTGSFKVNLKSNTNIVDVQGNGNNTNGYAPAYTSGGTHTVDRDNPTVSMSSLQSSPTNASSITVNITFSESVTGFTLGDIGITNGSASVLSGGGASYSIAITPTADGTVTVSIGANVAVDAANNNNNAASNFTITSDRTQPTVSISSGVANPTNSNSFSATVTFSESVTNFVSGDISAGNASISGFSGSGTTYTFTVTPSSDGTVTLNVGSGVANDAAGNGNSAATQFSRLVDRAAPTVSITSAASDPTNSNPIAVTVTFSESVSNFVSGDLSIGNGTASGFSGSGTTYTFNLAPSANGTVTVNIAANVANDAAGNGNNAATQFSRVFDSVSPTVSMSSGTSSPTNASSFSVSVTFSEAVTGFTSGDISVGNASLSNFSGSGSSYSFTLTPSAAGTVTANIVAGIAIDAAGNGNTAASQFSIVYDNSQPSVSITSGASNPTNSAFTVNFNFSEAVTGFVAGDVVVGNASISNFSGSGSSYSATITPSTAGTVTVSVGGNSASDAAGNGNTASSQFSLVYDNVQPTVSITSATSNPTNSSSIPVTVTFSEPVSNFVAGDLSVSNGSVSGFSGSGTTYTFTLTPSANGTVTVNIGANVANDAATNGNTAATQFSRTFDSVSPSVSITSSTASPTNATSIPVTVTFSESVSGFDASDIIAGNGSISGFSGSGTTYTFTLTPSANGNVTVSIVGGIATDAAGNGNTAATQFSIAYDNVQPTLSITSTTSSPTNSGSIPLTFTFSESVTGFTAADVSVANGSVSGFSGSGTVYTSTLTPSASGTVTVNVAANGANDAAGNGNAAASQFSIVYDNSQPTVSISSPASNPTNAASFTVNFTFSESVSNFVAGDVTVTNGGLSNFSGSGASYSATITPSADGTVTVNIAASVATDAAGNSNTAATQFSIVSDKAGPTLAITSTATNPTNANTIPLTFTFSESVTGFDVSDITALGGTLSAFAGSGSVYTATLTPSGDGSLSVFVFQNNATDAAGNGNAFASFSIVSDKTKPTVTISSTESTPTSANPIPISFSFSESTTNFTISDITVTGGTLTNFSGSGSSYTVGLIPSGNGNKTVRLLAGVMSDAAGNTNNASATFSIFYITPCSQTTTWNGFFWTGGDPVPTQPAVIAADYTVENDLSACSLIIGNNAQVIVNPGVDVTISGTVNVQAGSSFTFEAGSNLIQSGTSNSNVGNIIYKRPTTIRRLDYTYWSSPVGAQNLKAFSPQTVSPPVGASRFLHFGRAYECFRSSRSFDHKL